jgi:hypothetical protein
VLRSGSISSAGWIGVAAFVSATVAANASAARDDGAA